MIGFRETTLETLAVDHRVEVNTLTGSARLSVPLRTSPGREGFEPRLSLGYGSGQRNSAYGVGWFLAGIPSIGLDTSRGLPTYDPDADGYVYDGGQRLVPSLQEVDGVWQPVIEDRGDFSVQRFRSKTERSFERFERWTHRGSGRVHWVARARNGVVSVFGRALDGSTRIADPKDPDRRVYQWLLEAQYHPKGNAIVLLYKPEDGVGVDAGLSFEVRRARNGAGFAQRYLKRIFYGNTRPLSEALPEDAANEWRFEVVFDYGEHGADALPTPADDPHAPRWAVRADPFSTYRAGFEVRTYRLCRRVLMFHRFPELAGGEPCLVGATELQHREDAAGTALEAILHRGYRKHPDGSTSERALPALVLGYSAPSVEAAFEVAESPDNLPAGLDGALYRWTDVHDEGLPGIVSRYGGSWYFKENLGDGRFGPTRVLDEVPAAVSAAFQLRDFDGDGNLDLVGFEGREAGYFRHDRDRGQWEGFRSFRGLPRVDFANARVQWLDLNGDGHADLIVDSGDRLSWYPSEGADGFGSPVDLPRPDVGSGGAPTLAQNERLQTFFADMTGDGSLDMVRIDGGRVEYWPNLGRGQFGAGVVMEGAPTIEDHGELDGRRLRFVDLDGSGTADLLYIGRGEVRFWINESGNRFGAENRRGNLPYIDRLSSAQVFDFLGDGTRCLVWSTPLPNHEGQAIQYLRLTGDLPPRLLVSVANGIGRETRLAYQSSARDYLRDKNAGRPWRTLLPRHSMVVHRIEGLDHVGGSRMVMRYEYRDGHFDDDERRFAGFGQVDAFDADRIDPAGAALAEDAALPSVTRSWYHTGAAKGFAERAQDFHGGDPLAARPPLPHIEDVAALTTEEQLDAFRALAGVQWRQEYYALGPDGVREPHPYRTTELGYRVRRLQPATSERDAAFALEQSEALKHEYERDPNDPRVTHDFLLEGDELGNVASRVSVAYPRRPVGPEVRPEQQVLFAELTRAEHRNYDATERFELGIEIEQRRYSLTGLTLEPGRVFERAALHAQVETALARQVDFHETAADDGPRARLVQWRRNRFWNDAGTDVAAVGEVGAFTLLHHVERAALPDSGISALYEGRVDAARLSGEGDYRLEGGFWWADDTTYHYRDRSQFYRVREETSPGGGRQSYTFDPHLLLVTSVEDAFGNRVVSSPDYQVLASVRITDANDNVSEVSYDALGVAVVTTLRGEQLGSDGVAHPVGDDDLGGYVPVVGATAADVLTRPEDFLQGATRFFFYDLEAFQRGEGPPRSLHLEREQHRHDGEGTAPGASRIRSTVLYVDGFGRGIQTKIRADAGPAVQRVAGAVVVDGEGRPVLAHAAERWLTSGHEVFNDKGWLVRKYEPWFSGSFAFEDEQTLREYGVATRSHYDPMGRIVRQDLPDGTFTTSVYTAWTTRQADANDNVVGSAYEAERDALPPDDPERRALDGARSHADTPTIVEQDPLGRPFRLREIGADGAERVSTTVYGVLGLPDRIIDPRGLTAFTHRYDMLGRAVVEVSMDAGARWTFTDAQGRVRGQWDARGAYTRYSYDANGRPLETRVQGAVDFDGTVLDNVVERVAYGDSPEVPDAKLKNARGRAVRSFDDAGTLLFERYHMDGQSLDVRRSLRSAYKGTVDWSDPAAVGLQGAEHRVLAAVDALGRVVSQSLPDGTTRELTYAALGHVAEVRLSTADGALDRRVVASAIETNARGQRTRLVLGNGVETAYDYDPATFRLARLYAHRTTGAGRDYLDVRYTYDPVGNVVRWIDRVQDPGAPTPLLRGLTVSSACEFVYDPFYQLKEATGRVHQALLQHDYRSGLEGTNPIKGTQHLSLDNGAAIERYTRNYEYDLSGNLRSTRHRGLSRSWTTEVWTSATSNRSLSAQDLNGLDIVSPETHFDANGNTVRLPHLRAMDWNYANRLARAVIVDRSAAGETDDAEYYVYGADGLRVRRVTERLVAGEIEITETTYFDGCEIRLVRRGGNTRLLRHTSHVSDGSARLATLHQWSLDTTGVETDDIGQKKLHYLVGNHLGSVALELDEGGDVISYEEYFPCGGTSFLAGKSARDVKLKEVRYSGKCRDDATGLYHYEYRYYAPFIGNWISPDPLGPVDGLNLYRFVHNNPIRFVDADGLETSVPLQFRLELPDDLLSLLRERDNPEAPGLLESYYEGRNWEFEGQQYRLEGHVDWHTEIGAWFFVIESAEVQEPPVTIIDFTEEEVDAAGEGSPPPDEGTAPTVDDATADEADTSGTDAETDPAPDPGARGAGDAGDGPGAGDKGEGRGGGGEEGVRGRGTEGEGRGGRGTGGGGAQGGAGDPGARGGPGAGDKGATRAEGNSEVPAVPPGVPTGPDGIPYSPDLQLPEILPEAGTPVTDPSQVRLGGGTDPRGVPGSDVEGAMRPGGTEGSGSGGTADHTREGGNEDGQLASGSRGLKGGVGEHELPWWLSWIDTGLDALQVGLDIVGLVPGVGEIADGINGLISLARGDYAGAALSFAAMIPFAGWAATAGKFGRHAARAAGAFSGLSRSVGRYGDEAVSFGRRALSTASTTAANLITPLISRRAKGRILAVLDSGDALSRQLATEIRGGAVALHFRRLEKGTAGLYTGATTRAGAPILYVDSAYAFGKGNQFAEAAVTVVHEAQHLVDDLAGLFGSTSDRMLELRAFSREARFADAIGLPQLSDFGRIRASHGLQAAAKWMDKLYGF